MATVIYHFANSTALIACMTSKCTPCHCNRALTPYNRKLKNLQELDTIVPERDSAVAAASTYFEETAYVQQLIAEKNKRANNVEMLRHNQTCLLEECNKSNANENTHREKEKVLVLIFLHQIRETNDKRPARSDQREADVTS